MKIALTIAGSDSGGGAGVQADLKTFHQFGVFGTSVIVALTAQNTAGVRAVHQAPPEIVAAQLDALAEDLPPAALKTGMLASEAIVRLVAAAIRRHAWGPYVLDPVLAATSGARLLAEDATRALAAELLPLATLVTPNREEAALLTGLPVDDEAGMGEAGAALRRLGAGAALVKGGHFPGERVVDLLVTAQGAVRFEHPRLSTSSTHGTGCTLSAAITAGLALGLPLDAAVAAARDYLQRAIAAAPGLGRGGPGPVHHGVPAMTPSTSAPTRSPT